MKFRKDIRPEELDAFVLDHPYSHYMKTSFWADYKKKSEHMDVRLVGVEEDNKLAATAVVLKKRPAFALRPYLYVPTGMCVDYENRQLLDFFVDQLIELAKEEKANFLRIDPNVLRCHRSITGERIEDGFSHEDIAEYLKEKGFFTKGYGYAYNGSWINRYTLKIDLHEDMETIVSRFSRSRQNVLKRQKEQGIFTRLGRRDELHYLVDFEWDLTKTQGFKPHKVSFFEQLYDSLKEHVCYYITEIRLEEQIAFLKEELAGSKYRKDKEAREAKEKELLRAEELLEQYGNHVVLAAGLFVHYGINSWDLFTYMRKDFNNYNATDNLHLFAIEDMKERGVLYYDMVGFSGVTDKSDPYYGLYAYKRSFGPDFYEHIGEFDYILDKTDTERYKFLDRNIKRVRRKYYAWRYKQK